MKDQILKIAKVKSEKEFYKKYPTEEAFMKAHGKAFKKAAMGRAMVEQQLDQLTDFGNPPSAADGMNMQQPFRFGDALVGARARNAGISTERQMDLDKIQALDEKNQQQDSGMGDISGLIQQGMKMFGDGEGGGIPSDIQDAIGAGFEMRHGGYVIPKAAGGFDLAGLAKGLGGGSGGLGNSLVDMFGGKGKAAGIMGASQDMFKADGIKALGSKAGLATAGKAAGLGLLNSATDIIEGVGQIKEQEKQINKSNQYAQVSNLTATAAESKPIGVKKSNPLRYENDLVQPMNPQGTNTNYLAAYGAHIGGNPTEIQNIYNPGDLYNDLGYEPLSDSNVKQYKKGGMVVPKAAFGMNSGQAKVAGGVGSAVGSIFGPVGSMAGNLVGSAVGEFLLGGKADADKLAKYEEQGRQNEQRAAWASGAQTIQNQFASNMEDGGYMNPNYNPQVIAKFGDLTAQDFAKASKEMRSGGHFGQVEYTPPSAEALQTYAMGGDLKTHWGGGMEPMSYNPYGEGDGVTYMPHGQSHDETDGKGRSGIGITYGDNPVEVERGEPIFQMKDGGAMANTASVAGNMIMPKYTVDDLGDKNAKGKKFKSYIADLAKTEVKQNKIIDKATKLANDSDANDPFSQLSINSSKANLIGADMKLKEIANKKELAMIHQNAILDTAEELGVESAELAKGKLKAMKQSDMAKFGKNLKKAKDGDPIKKGNVMDFLKQIPVFNPAPQQATTIPYLQGYNSAAVPSDLPEVTVKSSKKKPVEWPDLPGVFSADQIAKGNEKGKKGKFDWKTAAMTLASGLNNALRPSNQLPLDPNQLMGEQFALATNQLEPVQAQTFQPMLNEAYKVSLQDQLNANQATFNALARQAGNDSAALSYLASQKYAADSSVLANQFRTNQEIATGVTNMNRDLVNKARLQNLGILDQQYVRQAQAKSNTKAQALAALNSISSKIAQNKLENRELGVYENMYNFRFNPEGRAVNYNPLASWSEPAVIGKTPEQLRAMAMMAEADEKSKKKSESARNGKIVQALKSKSLKPL